MGTRLRRAAFLLAGALGLLAATYGVLVLVASTHPPRPAHDFFAAPVRNLAHRGGGMLAPEATLAAFEAAARAGADVLEMDVRLSADGALVVIHDRTVDRTTDGSGAVGELRPRGTALPERRPPFPDTRRGFPQSRGAPRHPHLRRSPGRPSGSSVRRRDEDPRHRGAPVPGNPGSGAGEPDPGGGFRPGIPRALPQRLSHGCDRRLLRRGRGLPRHVAGASCRALTTPRSMRSWSAKPADLSG